MFRVWQTRALNPAFRFCIYPAPGTRFSNDTMGKMYYDRYWNETNFAAVEQFRALAAENGRDMVQMALAWVLSNKVITSIIMGATSMRHIEHNIAATDIKLSDDELKGCDDIWNQLRPLRFFYGR